MNSKTHYRQFVGNVTRENYDKPRRTKVVWEKNKTYSEKAICDMLVEAYNLGRKEACEEITLAVEKAKGL